MNIEKKSCEQHQKELKMKEQQVAVYQKYNHARSKYLLNNQQANLLNGNETLALLHNHCHHNDSPI